MVPLARGNLLDIGLLEENRIKEGYCGFEDDDTNNINGTQGRRLLGEKVRFGNIKL